MDGSAATRRRPRPVADAPVDGLADGTGLTKAWLLALVADAPLEQAASVPAADLARGGPALCGAMLAALRSDEALDRLVAGGDRAALAAAAGRLAGARTPQAVAAAIEALRGVCWQALLGELRDPPLGLVTDLADRLAHVCTLVTECALAAPAVEPPGRAGPLAQALAAHQATEPVEDRRTQPERRAAPRRAADVVEPEGRQAPRRADDVPAAPRPPAAEPVAGDATPPSDTDRAPHAPAVAGSGESAPSSAAPPDEADATLDGDGAADQFWQRIARPSPKEGAASADGIELHAVAPGPPPPGVEAWEALQARRRGMVLDEDALFEAADVGPPPEGVLPVPVTGWDGATVAAQPLPEPVTHPGWGGTPQPPWHAAVVRRLARRAQDGLPFAVLAVEVDDLDRLLAAQSGREVALALEVAERGLTAELAPADVVVRERLGRWWLTSPDRDTTAARDLAARVAAAIGRASLAGAPLTASVGVAVCPDDGDDADALLGRADEGLFGARAAGVRIG